MSEVVIKTENQKYLISELETLIQSESKPEIKKLLDKIHVADLSLLLSDFSREKKEHFVNLVGNNFPSDVFLKFNDYVCEEFIDVIGPKKSAKLISKLSPPEIISILEDLAKETSDKLVSFMPQDFQNNLETALNYPQDSAGRLMHKNFLSIPAHWTVKQANKHCVKNKKLLAENFYALFVVDHLFKPIGMVFSKELVVNDTSTKISDIMEEFVSFNYLTPKEELALSFQKYNLSVAPIVNNDDRIMGFVTIKDVADVIDEEAEEDILHLGGINESDIYTKLTQTIKQRFPWLFVNLITAILASIVIYMFDDVIKSLVALAVLMPIIASMGGNAGTQTVTIAVRALATQELNNQNTIRIIFKETIMGMINGLFFGLICFTAIMLIYNDIRLASLFALATIITLTIAGLTGSVIPVIIAKFNGDPAISSSIILTTITDVIAFLAFLGLANLFI